MIEWSDEAIAAALRVWLRLSEVGEFRDGRRREKMRQALKAAVEAQNRPDVMGNSLAKALIRATDLEIEVYRLKVENGRLREATLEEAAKSAEGFPKNREWVPGSLYDTLRREVAEDIRSLK